jgi:hypothetical protein
MLRQISREEAAGKTIKKIAGTDEVVIIFEDGTFMGIDVDKGYYGDTELDFNPVFDMDNSYSLRTMFNLGIISKEECEDRTKKIEEKSAEEEKRRQRRLLQELKEKEQKGEI